MKRFRLMVRAAFVVLYFVALVLLYTSAKGHIILVDNKKDPAGAWKEYRFFDAGLNGRKAVEFAKGDRVEFRVSGQNHRIRVELEDGTVVEREFTVPINESMMVLSVPKMIAGIEPWLEVFVPPVRVREPEPDALEAIPLPADAVLPGTAEVLPQP